MFVCEKEKQSVAINLILFVCLFSLCRMENNQIIPGFYIKEEEPTDMSSLYIDDNRSEFNGSVYSDESMDSNVSTVSNKSAASRVTFATNTKMPYVEKVAKKEQEPIVHRNTGTISVQTYRRRRLLSQSSIRLPDTLFDSTNNCTPKQEFRLSINQTPVFSHRPIQNAMSARAKRPMVIIEVPGPSGMARAIEMRRDIESPGVAEMQRAIESPRDIETSAAAEMQRAVGIAQDFEVPEAVVLPSTTAMNSIVTAPIVTVPRIVSAETVPNTFCVVCNQNYATRATLQTHLKSQKHQRNLNERIGDFLAN